MKRSSAAFTLLISILCSALHAQVYKKVLVEHFTNTYCSVCASRNPGFYTNLANHPDILHIAFHPSSPYPQCPLNQQNKPENDDRTKFYGIYGSTPRLVIQGDVIPGTSNYSDPAIFTPYLNKPAAIMIGISQNEVNDSLHVTLLVSRSAAQLPDTVLIYVALVSDTIAFTGSNGEPLQHDVFRKSLTKTGGNAIDLPPFIGPPMTLKFKAALNSAWNKKTLYTLVLAQSAVTKEIYNAAATFPGEGLMTGIKTNLKSEEKFTCFPNPFTDHLNVINKADEPLTVTLYNSLGILLTTRIVNHSDQLDLKDLPAGLYLIGMDNGVSRRTFIRIKL